MPTLLEQPETESPGARLETLTLRASQLRESLAEKAGKLDRLQSQLVDAHVGGAKTGALEKQVGELQHDIELDTKALQRIERDLIPLAQKFIDAENKTVGAEDVRALCDLYIAESKRAFAAITELEDAVISLKAAGREFHAVKSKWGVDAGQKLILLSYVAWELQPVAEALWPGKFDRVDGTLRNMDKEAVTIQDIEYLWRRVCTAVESARAEAEQLAHQLNRIP